MSYTLEIWEIVQPTAENIAIVKKNYNRLISRVDKANAFLTTVQNQEKYAAEIRIELLEPMANYINVLSNWGIQISDQEIRDGFKEV